MLLVLSALGTALGQDTNFPSGPQYLMKSGSPLFARPISTPSISLSGPPLEVGASDATGVLVAGAVDQNVLPPSPAALPKIDLFPIYYGGSPASVNPLPASIVDTGVSQVTTAHALRERGYGVTLAEGATYAKAQTRHATRVYTNADIDRLHNSGI
jgi:hypothetical protein